MQLVFYVNVICMHLTACHLMLDLLSTKESFFKFFFILKSFIIEFFHLCITHNSSTKIVFISKLENILRGPWESYLLAENFKTHSFYVWRRCIMMGFFSSCKFILCSLDIFRFAKANFSKWLVFFPILVYTTLGSI